MRRSASMVAFSTLCGLFVPSVLVRMSWMPTASSTLGSILASATRFSPAPLKGEAAGARGIRQRLHPAVILVATAIEHDALDAGRLGSVGQQRADRLGGSHIAAGLVLLEERLAAAVRRQHRAPRVVVDELRVDVAEAPEHRQPRSRRRAAQIAPQAIVPLVARAAPVPGDHFAPAFLPTLRRTYSSE